MELSTLLVTAASLGFIHTLLGPDHYLPFVALAKAKNWSNMKTVIVTSLCGIGHVLGSIIIGLAGVMFGVALQKVVSLETARGEIAGWLLLTFGLIYTIWGVRKAFGKNTHTHWFGKHVHKHDYNEPHKHEKIETVPWLIFIIFVFGPCEPLIPILIYPAAQGSYFNMMLVASVFGLVTISTMLVLVMILSAGIKIVHVNKLARFSHALAGFTILLCGAAIKLGL